jgi:hypothetical protein
MWIRRWRSIPPLAGIVLLLAAERGYDVEQLRTRRRGRPMIGTEPSEVVPVRLDPQLKQAVESRARAERTTTSAIIREAIRHFLDVA